MPLPALSAPPTQQQAGAVTAAALQLLKQQLKEPFILSLLNVGATNFKECGRQGTAPSILKLLAGSSHGRETDSQQQPASESPVGAHGQVIASRRGPVADGAPGASSASAAALSLQLRRDYGSQPCSAVLLTKSRERALREQALLPGATVMQQHMQPSPSWAHGQHQPVYQQSTGSSGFMPLPQQPKRQQWQAQPQSQAPTQLPQQQHRQTGGGSGCALDEQPCKRQRVEHGGASAQSGLLMSAATAYGHPFAEEQTPECGTALPPSQQPWQQHAEHSAQKILSYDVQFVPELGALMEFEVVESFETDDEAT